MGITSGQGKVSQPEYWLYFAIYTMLSVGSLISIFYFASQFRLAVAGLAALILIVSGLGFRVIEMWRCRDVGWPASLSWLIFGTQFLLGFISGAQLVSWGVALSLTFILGFIDFAFAIGIGLLPTHVVQQIDQARYVPIDYSGFKRVDGSATVSDLNATAMSRLEQAKAPAPATVITETAVATVPQRAGFGRKGL